MHAVTRRARQIARFVRAAVPRGMRAAVVAGEARLTDLGGRERAESLDVPLGLVVDVRLARTMAALAAERGRRRAGIVDLSMLRAGETAGVRVMTDRARLGPGVAGRWDATTTGAAGGCATTCLASTM